MKLLHNIGTFKHSNYNTREQVAACREQLSFDGVYLNVWENRDLLLGREHKTILFVMGKYVGGDNDFDRLCNDLPLERYCDWYHLIDLVMNYNCEIGWHSQFHNNLTSDNEDLEYEIKPPIRMRYFAYPYGEFNEAVIEEVKKHYEDAFSVHQGNGERYQRNRTYLT